MDDTLYAVGIGDKWNELWKWNATSDWTRCADMTSGRSYHCVAVVDSTLYTLGGLEDFFYNTEQCQGLQHADRQMVGSGSTDARY